MITKIIMSIVSIKKLSMRYQIYNFIDIYIFLIINGENFTKNSFFK